MSLFYWYIELELGVRARATSACWILADRALLAATGKLMAFGFPSTSFMELHVLIRADLKKSGPFLSVLLVIAPMEEEGRIIVER